MYKLLLITIITIFIVGNVILGEIEASSINNDQKVIPADLVGVNRDNITNERVLSMIQFLQSLDNDGNPDNNIEISEKSRTYLSESSLDFSSDLLNDVDVETVVLSANKTLVSKHSALHHYKTSLKNSLSITIFQEIEQETADTLLSTQEVLEEVIPEIYIALSEVSTTGYSSLQENEELQNIQVLHEIEKEEETKSIVEVQLLLVHEEEQNSSKKIKNVQPLIDIVPPIIGNIESLNDTVKNDVGFTYANQRVVNIEISALTTLFNKQVLFFESLKMITTPVGEIENLENKILSTVFNKEGKLVIKYTFANQITSIWMVVPYYGILMEIPIVNNRIYITLNEGVSS